MHRSRRPLIATAVCVVAGVATLVLALTPAAGATGARYVALGDSYSSGVGSGSYLSSSGDCLRSTRAYSQLWANAHAPSSYASVACSGASTTDLINDQVSALSISTTLVSVSIGGNDLNFAGVMEDCVLSRTSTCVSELDAAEATARASLPGRLDNAYNAIRSHAPFARVVVLDYPRFYHDIWYCVGLSSTDRDKINEAADVLDGVIQAAASRHGFAFADVRSAFGGGHEICDSSSWLHSVDWSDIGQSYHPTASGQSGGYLPAFTAFAR